MAGALSGALAAVPEDSEKSFKASSPARLGLAERTWIGPGTTVPGAVRFEKHSAERYFFCIASSSLPRLGLLHLRLLHIADVHLDTAFASRSREVRDRLRSASREAFARAVDVALDERVDALLIAGDLFDGAELSFETERFLLEQLARLDQGGVQVVYATGNHDPGDSARAGGLAWPESTTVVATAQPQTVPVLGRDGSTAGWVTAAGHATARETADLSLAMRPRTGTSLPQAALLHTQASSGKARPTGDVAQADAAGGVAPHSGVHGPYAPSNVENLRRAGFHYWALGHVHRRQAVSDDPPIHYAGNLQGRNPAETEPKGGLLVELGDPADPPSVEFREFAPVRWECLVVSGLEDARTLEHLVHATAEAWDRQRTADPGGPDTEWMAVVALVGPTALWRDLRRAGEAEVLEDELTARLGVLGVELRTAAVRPRVRPEEHEERRDVLGTVLRLAKEVSEGGDDLGLAPGDFAGFDPERDPSLEAYARRLMEGGAEEIVSRMIMEKDGPA